MCAKNEVAAAFILLSRLIAARLWDKNNSKRVQGALKYIKMGIKSLLCCIEYLLCSDVGFLLCRKNYNIPITRYHVFLWTEEIEFGKTIVIELRTIVPRS